jgi:hypothetical protein
MKIVKTQMKTDVVRNEEEGRNTNSYTRNVDESKNSAFTEVAKTNSNTIDQHILNTSNSLHWMSRIFEILVAALTLL